MLGIIFVNVFAIAAILTTGGCAFLSFDSIKDSFNEEGHKFMLALTATIFLGLVSVTVMMTFVLMFANISALS